MARIRRGLLVAPGSTHHCTWRAHDHRRVFEAEGAREKFLELISKYKMKHRVKVHSYCVMGTHPHVVCSSTDGQGAFSAFWKVVNHCFAVWFNRKHERRGQVVMERLRSPRIQSGGTHQLIVMRYGDLNPVRAGLVESPKDWKWSSYRHYAFGEENPLIDDAPEYLALGLTTAARRKAYQTFFGGHCSEPLHRRCAELVIAPFIGDAAWISMSQAALAPVPS